jgi:hypothetical protein
MLSPFRSDYRTGVYFIGVLLLGFSVIRPHYPQRTHFSKVGVRPISQNLFRGDCS